MIRTLIVDDERLARAELKRLLSAFAQVEVIGEAANAEQARDLIDELKPDLVFLDIQMPECTGLELAADLQPSLQFVFCTAFNSYALDAFSLNALDYLVKPVNPERLAKTLERAQQKTQPAATVAQPTQNYLPDSHGILLKFGESSRIVRLAEIARFESIGNHTAVYCPYGKSFVLSSLSKIEQRLDPQYFFKASRADIIRLDAIERIEPGVATGSLLAVLQNGQQVEVSRRQALALKQAFAGF